MTFDCAICFEPLEHSPGGRQNPSTRQIIRVSCGHLFHKLCLDEWLKPSINKPVLNCPNCRTVLAKNANTVQVYPDKLIKRKTKSKASVHTGPVVPSVSDNNKTPVDPGPAPVLTCGNVGCRDLRSLHANLMVDFNELQEKFTARQDEYFLLVAKKQSLMDEKNTLSKKQQSQADTIRKLIRRQQCKCVDTSANVVEAQNDDDEEEETFGSDSD